MPGEGPPIPTKFPCMVRAIYSWGGETKRDLGFIEGDLIECLNAGDGAWWMGRLKRNRAVGLFPSNFVEILDDQSSLRHPSRSPSPMPGGSRNASPAHGGYSRSASPRPGAYQAYKDGRYSRSPSPNPHAQGYHSRSPSPMPHRTGYNRSASPNPQFSEYTRSISPHPQMRSVSPAPQRYAQPSPVRGGYQRSVSPAPPRHGHGFDDVSPAPAPPPHRYQRSASPMPSYDNLAVQNTPGHSRAPSPSGLGNTPSPLRTAMDDVMASLEHMTNHDDDDDGDELPRPRTPVDPWSPAAFGQQLRSPSPRKAYARPQTSLGINYDDEEEYAPAPRQSSRPRANTALTEHIDQMEDRLRRFNLTTQRQDGYYEDDDEGGGGGGGRYRPQSAMAGRGAMANAKNRRSAYEMGGLLRDNSLSRATTVKTNSSKSTTTTTSTAITSTSLMSGMSAGGFSATSAGSLARKKARERAMSVVEQTNSSQVFGRVDSPSFGSPSPKKSTWGPAESPSVFGGLTAPKPKKKGFLKKILDGARASTASARSVASSIPPSPIPASLASSVTGTTRPPNSSSSGSDWVQVRRDVNRANTLSKNERIERQEKQQMMDFPVLRPVDALEEDVDGDEAYDGNVVHNPADISGINFTLVDKAARFITNLPPFSTPESLATSHICRPYRTDVQKVRAIFTWCAEKIAWEPGLDSDGLERTRIDGRKVIQSKHGSPEDVATVVAQMCRAVGIHCDIVRGFLKTPGEVIDLDKVPRPNHWWNSVLVDGEWRFMDCSLASPTHPERAHYSSCPANVAESFFFLTRPCQFCYTHVPLYSEQQHMVPPLPMPILLALPNTSPNYFKSAIQMVNYDTSLIRIEDLEVVQIEFSVPADIECVAEVEAKAFSVDQDGDVFETGEIVKKRALAQVAWEDGVKTYRVKAVLPGDEGQGILKVYAGKKGLMHSIKDNPYPLAFSVPIIHTGENPPYEFLLRHPTPHAQRHDLYVSQPQCLRLAVNNTFVFAVRQHPSGGPPSPNLSGSPMKPAKLAIQTPSGKILRLMKKTDLGTERGAERGMDGMVYETIIKCNERGAWRALVLADRTVRWCVYAEWVVC